MTQGYAVCVCLTPSQRILDLCIHLCLSIRTQILRGRLNIAIYTHAFLAKSASTCLQTSSSEGIEVGARLPREHPVTSPRHERWRQFERYPLSFELTRCWHVPSLSLSDCYLQLLSAVLEAQLERHLCLLMMTQPSGICGCTVLEVMACVAYVATYTGPLRLSQLDLCVSVCVTEYHKRQLACSRSPSLVPRPPPHPQVEILKSWLCGDFFL